MQRWIAILGMIVSAVLMCMSIGASVRILINAAPLWALVFTGFGVFTGVSAFLFFIQELAMTFKTIARFVDAMESPYISDKLKY